MVFSGSVQFLNTATSQNVSTYKFTANQFHAHFITKFITSVIAKWGSCDALQIIQVLLQSESSGITN